MRVWRRLSRQGEQQAWKARAGLASGRRQRKASVAGMSAEGGRTGRECQPARPGGHSKQRGSHPDFRGKQ